MDELVPKKDYTEPKKFEKKIEGKAIIREKGFLTTLKETFLSSDVQNVREYIFKDVVIPAIKDTVVSIVQNGIEMLFYGDTKANSITRHSSNATYVSYSSMYKNDPRERKPVVQREQVRRAPSNRREFIYPTRGQAEDALHLLQECLEDYQVASVADLIRISNDDLDILISDQYTDNDWGWYDLSGSYAKRLFRGQWMLVLPEPVYIK